MVICTNCSVENSIDSRFCKGCGEELSQNSVHEAREKLEILVSEGFRAFSDGRVEEARMIADKALSEDPGSSSAVSLAGMCHERAGEIAEALDCFERVVAMNPDSALDRIKVTHLRRSLSGGHKEPPRADRKTALVGAFAAIVLVVSLGVAMAGFINRDKERAALVTTGGEGQAQVDPKAQQPSLAQPNSNATISGTPNQPNTVTGNPGGNSAIHSNSGGGSTQERAAAGSPVPSLNSNGKVEAMPSVGAGTSPIQIPSPMMGNISIRPSELGAISSGGAANTAPKNPPNSGSITPARNGESPDPQIDGKAGASDPPKQDNGFISIRVASKPPSFGGSVDAPDGNTAEALVRSAQSEFLLGKFDSAAKKYENALRAGADRGRTNQRLAQCYDRLGRDGEAISAYGRAIAAYEDKLKSGTGNPSGIQAALDVCKQALKVLKGG